MDPVAIEAIVVVLAGERGGFGDRGPRPGGGFGGDRGGYGGDRAGFGGRPPQQQTEAQAPPAQTPQNTPIMPPLANPQTSL